MARQEDPPQQQAWQTLFEEARQFASSATTSPWPTAEELAVIFPTWKILDPVCQGERSLTWQIQNRTDNNEPPLSDRVFERLI